MVKNFKTYARMSDRSKSERPIFEPAKRGFFNVRKIGFIALFASTFCILEIMGTSDHEAEIMIAEDCKMAVSDYQEWNK